MQSPILEIRSKNGGVLIKRDLYTFVQSFGAHWKHLAPFQVLLDGIDVEPPPVGKTVKLERIGD